MNVWGLVFSSSLQTMREQTFDTERVPPSRVAQSQQLPILALTSVKIPLMNISPYRTDADLSNLIDSTVVIACTQNLQCGRWLIFTQEYAKTNTNIAG